MEFVSKGVRTSVACRAKNPSAVTRWLELQKRLSKLCLRTEKPPQARFYCRHCLSDERALFKLLRAAAPARFPPAPFAIWVIRSPIVARLSSRSHVAHQFRAARFVKPTCPDRTRRHPRPARQGLPAHSLQRHRPRPDQLYRALHGAARPRLIVLRDLIPLAPKPGLRSLSRVILKVIMRVSIVLSRRQKLLGVIQNVISRQRPR